MAKYTIPVQPLILTVSGQKPTIPSPSTIMPTDSRFDITSDIMVGQLAYNVIDDAWYYRSGSAIKLLTSSTTLTVEEVSTWDEDTVYIAGNTFVSYSNSESSDPDYQTAYIYKCIITTSAGESPETTPAKWERQGATVDDSNISFLDLSDVSETSYEGLADKYVKVNSDGDGLTFIEAPTSETITVDTVEVWSEYETYEAGNTFVSYVDESSSDEQFQTEALYRCAYDTSAGEDPENYPEKWIYQGQEVTISGGNTSNTIVETIEDLQTLTGYEDTDSVFVIEDNTWYKYDSDDTSGVIPNESTATGSWIVYYVLAGTQAEIIYGCLYKYSTAIDTTLTSSDTWVVPTKAMVTILDNYITTISGDDSTNALWLKSERYAYDYEEPRWEQESYAGNNTFNFNGVPAGYIDSYTGSIVGIGNYATYWCTDAITSNKFHVYSLDNYFNFFSIGSSDYTLEGHAIRLVRDASTSEQTLDDGTYLSEYTGNDGTVYKTVKIGTQVWLAENLAETKLRDGSSLDLVTDYSTWIGSTDSAYCYPEFNEDYFITEVDGLIDTKIDTHYSTNKAIVAAQSWDGSSYSISLTTEKLETLTVEDTITSITIGLSFAEDSSSVHRERTVIIDNSSNTSAISSITFDDNDSTYTWNWADGDPITGIAIGAKVILKVENISDAEVFATTITLA